MNDLVLDIDLMELKKERDSIAKILVVTNETEKKAASDVLKLVKGAISKSEEKKKTWIQPLKNLIKQYSEEFDNPISELLEKEKEIKNAILTYDKQQEILRLEEQIKLKKIQETEAKKKELLANQEELRGNDLDAEIFRQQAEIVRSITPIVPPQEKIKGLSTKKIWKMRVVNPTLLPKEYLMPNEKMLNEIARATKGSLNIPGVEFYFEESLSSTKA